MYEYIEVYFKQNIEWIECSISQSVRKMRMFALASVQHLLRVKSVNICSVVVCLFIIM